jgi:hypothetical protein
MEVNGMTHALVRARERISEDIPPELMEDLRIALSDPGRWSDYIEPVMDRHDGATIYRFRVVHGIFYVVARNGYPVTILTQEQFRAKRRIKRAARQRPKCYDPRRAKA